ncbi:Oidioi.mRNA.OKI2018_I69.chr1.g1170.t1.cds [Oikopleura dioica]|uniref:Oidioi.mRNA.OKI2018_I69.chr1.g1170.t1.cds n=1 Tax=Oikopleura dioica TaxID=34765 RepID=A0ABN7SQP3_OIKDI|nr:Oidioi.mRNA.OKI2018_I69.chr1.g1170.t1.cds [Oikopleura dioica]
MKNERPICSLNFHGIFLKLGKRQPLIKTNGILFLKTREKEELRQRGKPYQDVKDCAMTRSNVVADWTLDLKDHQDYCDQEIESNLHKKLQLQNSKIVSEDSLSTSGISEISSSSNQNSDSNSSSSSFSKSDSSRASTRFQKVAEKVNFSEKLKKMKQKFSKQSSPKNPFEIKEDFTPPPSAAPKPQLPIKKEENKEGLKLSVGQQQSKILRLHCEQCVLKDKPQDFQSVLFVCQL